MHSNSTDPVERSKVPVRRIRACPKTTEEKKYRDIAFLCHGGRHDTSILKRIGFDIQDILPIIAIIDTENISQAVFNLPKGPSLSDLLTRLDRPWGALHKAGNDSRFTINALLALAVESGMKASQELLLQLQQVACAPVSTLR